MRLAPQLAIHFPHHPQQQQAAGQRQAQDLQQTDRHQPEADPDRRRSGDTQQDRQPPLLRRQTRHRQPDDNGVVAGEGDVDQHHLDQRAEIMDQPMRHAAWSWGCKGALAKRRSLRSSCLQAQQKGRQPVMVPRYTRPQMAAIWAPENRFRIWFEIEALAAEAMAQIGSIPKRGPRDPRGRVCQSRPHHASRSRTHRCDRARDPT